MIYIFTGQWMAKNGKHYPIDSTTALFLMKQAKGEGASFTGAFVGMACHDTSGRNCIADFDFFEYIERPS